MAATSGEGRTRFRRCSREWRHSSSRWEPARSASGGTGAGALIFDLLVIFALSVGVIFLVGKIPPPKRSIFGLIGGVSNLLAAPDTGMWKASPSGCTAAEEAQEEVREEPWRNHGSG